VLPRLRDVDLIFCDPPFPWYANGGREIAALLRLGAAALARDGRLVIRGERGADLPPLPEELVETGRRVYGRSWLALFHRA
jgi:16S rRNA G966 N2-methylase RsmD